jgi:hypothetical protein
VVSDDSSFNSPTASVNLSMPKKLKAPDAKNIIPSFTFPNTVSAFPNADVNTFPTPIAKPPRTLPVFIAASPKNLNLAPNLFNSKVTDLNPSFVTLPNSFVLLCVPFRKDLTAFKEFSCCY